jgi:2,3-bisphosphoglycerate-dependent phosphoglycerate mutase
LVSNLLVMPPCSTPPSAAPFAPGSSEGTAFWLVRHGESTWNTAGLAQGHNDQAELTSRGQRQAAAAAERFRGRPVRAIYASDLRRALQTATAFGRVVGLPVITDIRLRERSLGVLEGSPATAIGPEVTGLGDGRVLDPDARPAGGESVRDLYWRAAEFCDDLTAGDLVAGDLTSGEGDVLIVAHGGTVRVLEAYLHGTDVAQMRWEPVGNATVVRIPHDPQPAGRSPGTEPVGPRPRGGN